MTGIEFEADTSSLRETLAALKEIDPAIATNLRRQLRGAGADIIDAQRAALAERPPRIPTQSGTWRLVVPHTGRKPYMARRSRATARQDGQLRQQIAAGLRTRVVTSASREGIEIKTTGPRIGGSNMARVWQSREFRHPVFGGEQWVPQRGSAYFFDPVTDELRGRMRERVDEAVKAALQAAAAR